MAKSAEDIARECEARMAELDNEEAKAEKEIASATMMIARERGRKREIAEERGRLARTLRGLRGESKPGRKPKADGGDQE